MMTIPSFKSIIVLTILLSLTGAILKPFNPDSVTQLGSNSDLSALPLTFPAQSKEVIEYFNDIAQPEDLVSLPDVFLKALPEIKAGQTMIAFSSWEDAERTIPNIATQIDWVLYNPEHWENTPTTEQQNLPVTVQKATEFLRARDLRLFLAPDRRYVDEVLDDLAPHADALLLQGQRLQDDPELFASWMTEKIKIARAANPEILIYVQVGANQGTAEEMLRAIQTVSDQIDGIAIWSTPRTLDTLQAFIDLLRPPSLETTTVTASPNETQALPDSTREPTGTAPNLTPTSSHTSTPSIEDETPETPSISLTPTLTSEGQWIPYEKLPLICLGVMMVTFLGVLTAVLIKYLRKYKSRSG